MNGYNNEENTSWERIFMKKSVSMSIIATALSLALTACAEGSEANVGTPQSAADVTSTTAAVSSNVTDTVSSNTTDTTSSNVTDTASSNSTDTTSSTTTDTTSSNVTDTTSSNATETTAPNGTGTTTPNGTGTTPPSGTGTTPPSGTGTTTPHHNEYDHNGTGTTTTQHDEHDTHHNGTGTTTPTTPVQAQGSEFTYKRDDSGVEITGCSSTAENIVIPNTIDGMRVVAICGNRNAPLFPNAKTITLPNTLEEIDEYAFANCKQLREITIPASVEDIDDYAFMNCTALSSITFTNGRLEELGDGVFSGCTSLTRIQLPDTLHEIEYNTFDTRVNFTVTYRGVSYTPANINDLCRILH